MKLTDLPWWIWAMGGTGVILLLSRRASAGSAPLMPYNDKKRNAALALRPFIRASANRYGIPEEVIGGILDRESLFGLYLSSDLTGDGGHGRGLMQIDDRFHANYIDKGTWKDPASNIDYGVSLLASYHNQMRMTPTASMRTLIKSAQRLGIDPGQYPDPRPLIGQDALTAAIAAYNAGTTAVLDAIAAGFNPDLMTTGKNYSADVLFRADEYRNNVMGFAQV